MDAGHYMGAVCSAESARRSTGLAHHAASLLRRMAPLALFTVLLTAGLLRPTPAPAIVVHASALHATGPVRRHAALPVRHHKLTRQRFKKRCAALAPSPPRHSELLPADRVVPLRIGHLGTQARWHDRARAPPTANYPG
jgi:hypothetical protein